MGGGAKFNSIANSWMVYNPSNSGLPNYYPYCIAFNKNYIKTIGSEGSGIVLFNDTTWQVFNTTNSPLPNNTIIRIAIDKLGNTWIGTLNGLAIYNPNSIIGINAIVNVTPQDFKLYQNFPNPFNPVTNIKYSLPRPSEGGVQAVKLIIYDITGREIAVLVNEEQKHGDYEVNWNASNYTSGVYFYTFCANGYSESKKMILLK